MTPTYSRKPFEGYTHRFQVDFITGCTVSDYTKLDIYSDCDSFEALDNFITANKKERVRSFEILYRSSKAQDEANRKFIDEVLANL